MILTDREYQYWLTRHCPRELCWVVAARLGEMISHENTKLFNHKGQPLKSINLTHENLSYIYFTIVDKAMLLTLVQNTEGYYLIENHREVVDGEEKKTHIDSIIRYAPSLDLILETLSSSRRKHLGIKKRDKIKLKSSEVTALKGIVSIDFIDINQRDRVWERYVAQSDGVLDLSGLHTLPLSVVQGSKTENKHITDLILYQNVNIYEFDWLNKFPNITLISIWYINMIEDHHVHTLVRMCPKLCTIEFHHCYQITGRVLIPLTQHTILSRIIIDNPQLPCQDNPFTTVIKRTEWEAMSNSSIQFILINSANLTLDFIYFILKTCKVLEKFVMNLLILEKVYKNSFSGNEPEKVIFQADSDHTKGFVRNKDVKLYGLLCDQMDDNAFSATMLQKIAERDPKRFNAVGILSEQDD